MHSYITVTFENGLLNENVSLLNLFGERGWRLFSIDTKQEIDSKLNYSSKYFYFNKEFTSEALRDADSTYSTFTESYIFDTETYKTNKDALSAAPTNGALVTTTEVIGVIVITLSNGITEENSYVFNTFGSFGWELNIIDSDQPKDSSLTYSSKNYIIFKKFNSKNDLDTDDIYTEFGESYIFNKEDFDNKIDSI